MSESQTEEMSLRDMMAKASIKQKYIAQKAKVSPAAVSLIVAGKSKSKRLEDFIREEVKKALAQGQEA